MPSSHRQAVATPRRPLGKMAKEQWLGWSPLRVGALALIMFALPMLAAIWKMYDGSDQILQESIRRQLLGAARGVARVVDPELHGTFTARQQEQSAPYQTQIAQMEGIRRALDVVGVIKFVYTCVERDGAICFVLDTTVEGDADQDGTDDKSHIMEVYEAPSETLRTVLKTGVAAVDQTPYKDRWGTFMSAYAPVFNDRGRVVAATGVDMALTDYNLQRAGVRDVAVLSVIGACGVSLIGAWGVAMYHRRLQRSISRLVAAGEVGMLAARTKTEFLSALSHELRTPLNAVVGMADQLSESSLDAQQRAHLSTIERSGEDLLNTLTDILDFSALDGGSIALAHVPVSAKMILNDLQSHFRKDIFAKGVTFGVGHDPQCPDPFIGDPAHVRQLLRHLIANAIKFTESGSVTVQAKPVQMPSGKPGIYFIVSDTGIGMTRAQQKRVFEPFYQPDGSTNRRAGGRGIGLAICKRICDAMEGRIWVVSSLGKGCAFHVQIPADPVVESEDREVLVCSTDSVTQTLVSSVAEKQGNHVRIVRSIEELGNEHSKRPARWLLVDAAMIGPEQVSAINDMRGKAQVIVLNADPRNAAPSVGVMLPHPLRPADLRQVMAV